jgi:hypothetical protein
MKALGTCKVTRASMVRKNIEMLQETKIRTPDCSRKIRI